MVISWIIWIMVKWKVYNEMECWWDEMTIILFRFFEIRKRIKKTRTFCFFLLRKTTLKFFKSHWWNKYLLIFSLKPHLVYWFVNFNFIEQNKIMVSSLQVFKSNVFKIAKTMSGQLKWLQTTVKTTDPVVWTMLCLDQKGRIDRNTGR